MNGEELSFSRKKKCSKMYLKINRSVRKRRDIPWNSENKPLQIKIPQTLNAKNPPLNCPLEYKPPGGLSLEIALKYKLK